MQVVKRDGSLQEFNGAKIVEAISKAFDACCPEESKQTITTMVEDMKFWDNITIEEIQDIVVETLRDYEYDEVATAYSNYRDTHAQMRIFEEVENKIKALNETEDKSNANANSDLVSTKRSIIASEWYKGKYKYCYLNKKELKAHEEGFIYIHDIGNRLSSFNCDLFNIARILKGGFTLSPIDYVEPKTIDAALATTADIMNAAAGQQYGGMTIPQIDEALAPYCQKSYDKFIKEYYRLFQGRGGGDQQSADEYAVLKITRDIEQRIQGMEHAFNSIASSRGDYPFFTFTFGHSTDRWATLISSIILKVRKEGQGKPGHKVPVVFPKLVFLYDSELHGEGKELEWLFKEAVECSKVAQYPDYLSLDTGYIGEVYHKWGKIVSPMGCRAYLSPVFKNSGTYIPQDNNDEFLIYRCNMGVISLNLPLIYQEAKIKNIPFYTLLIEYMQIIRGIHKKTINFLKTLKAKCDPLAFCEGGLDGGNLNPDDTIESVLKYATISFGYGGLNELELLHSGKTIYENGEFALETLKFIEDTINKFKEEDNILYALYGTPGESWLPLACKQFKDRFGDVNGVTKYGYFSNSFHCHVTEDITPLEKMESESRFWDIPKGGRIMYGKLPVTYNTKAIIDLIRYAMSKGLYYGVNHAENHCYDCGLHWVGDDSKELDNCPECNSDNIIKIRRMNGYLSYTRTKEGKTRYHELKDKEIRDRKSM